MGTLFVCATPIGNLSDCSFRLIETLKSVSLIAAEDTRHTKILLDRYGISKPLISLQKFNEQERVSQLLNTLQQGKDIALVSDAGTPCIADPGSRLVAALTHEGAKVCPIPGPSAVVTLLSASGLDTDNFYFGGFFPRKESEALAMVGKASQLGCPAFFFESPKRILATLERIKRDQPEAKIVVGKELTKKFETIWRGTVQSVYDKLKETNIKGEWCFALLVPEAKIETDVVQELKREGFSLSQVLYLSEKFFQLPRNNVYKEFHRD